MCYHPIRLLTMPLKETTNSPETKREVAHLYEVGELSECATRDILGDDWGKINRLNQLFEEISPQEEDFEGDDLLL